MKTIAIDIRLIGKKRTGDEVVFYYLTKALLNIDAEHSKRHYLLLTDESGPAKLALLRGRLGCIGRKDVDIVSLGGRNRFFWNLWTVPRYLRRERIDVYHTQYILPFFIPKRTRAVTHIHDVSFRAYPEHIAASDRFFLALLIPRSLRKATHILAPSAFTKDEIIKYYAVPSEKITVIPNAAQDIFREKTDETRNVRAKYRLPEKYFLYVGTLQPRKNIPFLLKAFAEFCKRAGQEEIKLVLVGSRSAHNVDRSLETHLRELRLSENVYFPGYVDDRDLVSVMREALAFVFPSLYEGFGIPLIEAMTQGVPVVAADIPSLREVGGEAALYVESGNVARFAETLYSLSIDSALRAQLAQAGLARTQEFTWEKSAEKLLALYRSL